MDRRATPIMLFAAGFGTRMAPLTDSIPKCLVPVAGKPLLDHALALIDPAQMSPTVINTHHHAAQISDHLAGTDLRISHEATGPFDTGGGLKHALPLLGNGPDFPVLTLNTDAVWTGPNPLIQIMNAWNDHADALVLLVPAPTKGDFDLAPDGRITRGTQYRYTGAQIIRTGRITRFAETRFSLNVIWDQMIRAGTAFGVVLDGQWCDVGDRPAIARAEKMLVDDVR